MLLLDIKQVQRRPDSNLFQEKLEFIPVFLCKLESRKSLSRKGKVRIECKNSRIPVFSENGWLDQQLCKEEALRASATPRIVE